MRKEAQAREDEFWHRKFMHMDAETALRLSALPKEEWRFELIWIEQLSGDYVSDEERILAYQEAKKIHFREKVNYERQKN